MKNNPAAGMLLDESSLTNIPELISAYYTNIPDAGIASQRISFGTSGHRGSSLNYAFNQTHILAISQAICSYREQQKISGPLFIGIDTHALSLPAFISAMEVLAANGVVVMFAGKNAYTPTPVISHAILKYNKGRTAGLADGIVITPSHNPPQDGGFKYNPPHGGPAESAITKFIENHANKLMESGNREIKRVSYQKALQSDSTHVHDFLNDYIVDLNNVIKMDLIRDSGISIGVDPLGGAGIHYWEPIAEHYKINLSVVNKRIDPTFRFMTADWDGQIRMDPSSAFAMQSLIKYKDQFDISFSCDTDHDRHGIVTKSSGLIPPNHYLSVAIDYLFRNRPGWSKEAGIGKTLVSSQMIDRVAKKLGRKLYEVPVGFKWFVEGCLDGSLAFVGEESAGASFARLDGSTWTTDKDGITLGLLAAEITAATKKDPGMLYHDLTESLGTPLYDRVEAPATPEQKKLLEKLSPQQIESKTLAGEDIKNILTNAPGNGAAIGGLKVETENGWFAARPSGTENIYKIYAESFLGKEHLSRIVIDAQEIVNKTLS